VTIRVHPCHPCPSFGVAFASSRVLNRLDLSVNLLEREDTLRPRDMGVESPQSNSQALIFQEAEVLCSQRVGGDYG
jgi:hypothetical protein